MQKLKPVACRSNVCSLFPSTTLSDCRHVCIPVSTKPHGHSPVYSGPHHVIRRTKKTISVSIQGHDTSIAIGRTKPAFVLDNDLHGTSLLNHARREVFAQLAH
ncbi:hypothetical protein T10_6392 [Trichinella papuae]|uniref:Uncharacterized protein n=1 Tax=Trichinella papuae TaxID=268474 RepID=A0A0V1MA99_9BILA|nr:hypothetical protein T10_6392 [Trichinella papuae]